MLYEEFCVLIITVMATVIRFEFMSRSKVFGIFAGGIMHKNKSLIV
jgi:hypothetical protein